MPRQLRPARRGSGAASGRKASLPFHSPELRGRHRAVARTGWRPVTAPGRSEEMVAGHHRQSEGGGGEGRRRVCAVLNGASERTEIHDVGNRREYSQLTSGPRKHTMPSLSETLRCTQSYGDCQLGNWAQVDARSNENFPPRRSEEHTS